MTTKRLCILLLVLCSFSAGITAVLEANKKQSTRDVRTASPPPWAVGTTHPGANRGLANEVATLTPASTAPMAATAGRLSARQAKALRQLKEKLAREDESVEDILKPLRAWAKQDPAGCASWVIAHLEGSVRQRCLEEAVAAWLQQQPPQTVLDWLEQQSYPGLDVSATAGAYSLALAALAQQDGFKAVAWLKDHPSQGSLENWQSVLGDWAENNGSAALQWVLANSLDSRLKDALLPNLLTSFRDPGTTAMLLRGSAPAVVDDALASATRATSSLNPEYALSLARQITDSAEQGQMVNYVFARWLDVDAQAAQNYATKIGMPLTPTANAIGGSNSHEQPVESVAADAPPVLPR